MCELDCYSNIPLFLIEKIKKQYPNHYDKILKGYDVKRFTTLRVNTLKSSIEEVEKCFSSLGIVYEKIDYYQDAFIIKNADYKYISNLDIYESGKIYLQSLSSMLPPLILSPMEKKDILDMAASPGSKTSQMASLANNNAFIMACEVNKIRMERLKYNMNKLGVSCVNYMLTDSRKLDDYFSFDQILLDAPCSGSGTLSTKKSNKISLELVNNSARLQKELLKKAIKIVKVGGTILYSTCSILEEENEKVINAMLKDENVVLEKIDVTKFKNIELLPTKIDGTMVVMPNEIYEGFFVALLRKVK